MYVQAEIIELGHALCRDNQKYNLETVKHNIYIYISRLNHWNFLKTKNEASLFSQNRLFPRKSGLNFTSLNLLTQLDKMIISYGLVTTISRKCRNK